MLAVSETGQLTATVNIHIQEVCTLLLVGFTPTLGHHLSDGERIGLELEKVDEFVADHVRIIRAGGWIARGKINNLRGFS